VSQYGGDCDVLLFWSSGENRQVSFLQLFADRMFASATESNDGLCKRRGGQAFQLLGYGSQPLPSAAHRWNFLLLRGCAQKYLPLRRLHILTLPIVLICCAELVAACLQSGGLLSASSNPGSATPSSLHKLYSKKATSTGNPFALRQLTASIPQSMHASYSARAPSAQPFRPSTTRSNSPPRTPLRVVSVTAPPGQLQLSLTSLGGYRR